MSKGANCSHEIEHLTSDCDVVCPGCTGNICMHDDNEIKDCKTTMSGKKKK